MCDSQEASDSQEDCTLARNLGQGIDCRVPDLVEIKLMGSLEILF